MPSSVKLIPISQWVWELREKLESVHTFIRPHTGQAICKQNKLHDPKLYYEKLNQGDKVYIYFPVKKVGLSSKLTSFWKGQFRITEKLSDLLYKVDCGYGGSIQIIYIDRIKKAKEQVLTGD
jgi:hypothetical protein